MEKFPGNAFILALLEGNGLGKKKIFGVAGSLSFPKACNGFFFLLHTFQIIAPAGHRSQTDLVQTALEL